MKLKFATALLVLILLLLPMQVFAASITLDGQFSDWTDKPQIMDLQGDEKPEGDIISSGWYPDTSDSNLYIYCKRLSGLDQNKKKPVDWNFEISFKTNSGNRTAFVYYHPESRQVEVTLIDNTGHYLWCGKGKWGEDKASGQQVEFYIPLDFLTGCIPGGYQFDMFYTSGNDRVPDRGAITISTASTFPIYSAIILAAFVILGLVIGKTDYFEIKNRQTWLGKGL
jgi:hypothetical protein